MLFSSLEFLYGFLPVVLLCYFLCPVRFRNGILLAFSLLFYAWGEPKYLFLMLFTVLMDYTFGLLIDRYRERSVPKRCVLILAIALNLSLLAFFKYTDFFLETIRDILLFSFVRPLGIVLPLGISFYIFQALSYVIDVYRGDAVVQKNPIRFALYVSLFPQLVAGPIVRYRDVDDALSVRKHSLSHVINGFLTFSAGLAKKVLLANAFGALWNTAYQTPAAEQTACAAWLGMIAFMLQIYFDFSGYSDMAIGLGRVFGFHFPENFAYPYTAESITDFWRRWHISLSTWFREYVYIPLGGNRKGRLRTYLNLLAVWALTGIWHGASWNFLLWGLYYWLLLIFEKAFFGRILQRLPCILRHLYALPLILLGWLIFAFDGSETALSLSAGISYFLRMLGIGGAGIGSAPDLYEAFRNGLLLLIAVIACLPHPKRLFYRLYARHPLSATLLSMGAICLSLVFSTAYLADSAYNPFLYFRF